MPGFQRCLAAALRILPRRFRDRFGEELAAAALALAEDARSTGGRRRRWRYVARELVALAGLAIALARRGSVERKRTTPGRAMWGTLREELAWTVRHTRRRPVFALAVIVTLAASIAAATTAFGLARSFLWRARAPGGPHGSGRRASRGRVGTPAARALGGRNRRIGVGPSARSFCDAIAPEPGVSGPARPLRSARTRVPAVYRAAQVMRWDE